MFDRRRNRSNGTIDKLQPELKDTVDQMLLSGQSYREIVEYLQANEVTLSQMSVCRYARKFLAGMEQLRMANENMRMVMEEMEKYPDFDASEAILRINTQNVFNALSSAPPEVWETVKPDKLLREATSLVRAAGYKKQIDHRLQTDTERALEANQSLLYDILARKYPDLYRQLQDVLKAEKEALGG